ncbi:peptidoglycan DD-metalloendopeptidase family protein [Bacillus timonensis]|nr:peptidoglycan DD-metalloendopeptidase family protein [Bacillus timonensis]
MQDIIKRLVIAVIMGICIGVLFIGGRSTSAESTDLQSLTKDWAWPVSGNISDHFGTRHGRHKGIDIVAEYGEEVFSVDDGVVNKSYYSSTYGHVVFIKHPNGFETVYAHLSKRLVKEGDKVTQGQLIGNIGNSGISTGAHLHFEIHNGEWNYQKDHAIDPLTVLSEHNLYTMKELNEQKLASHQASVYSPQSQSSINNTADTVKAEVEAVSANYKNEENLKTVIVERNDTLWGIAVKENVSIESIMEWNSLNTTNIQIGQKLVVYAEDEKVYVVQAGDSLNQIAKTVGISVEKLKELNNLKNDLIFPQQVLVISRS